MDCPATGYPAFVARQIADADPDAGALLPCDVLVRECPDGSTTVAFMDPVTVLCLSESEEVKALAETAKQDLLKVADRLGA